ncbi:MAG: DUF3996 domain-containing protein [Deltaproteobacteria bacterium]|nr:DUF3996 domain-containing protein [Deltaproteobacteria bacterium]
MKKPVGRGPVACAAAAVALAISLSATGAQASEIGNGANVGVGLMLGAPSGLSLKFFFHNDHAVDVGVGVGYFGGATLYVHADYLFHFQLLSAETFELPLYIGIGGKFTLWFYEGYHGYWGGYTESGRFGAGVRVPIGIAFELNAIPIDIFLEIVPGLGVFPGIGAFIDGAIGARYYF